MNIEADIAATLSHGGIKHRRAARFHVLPSITYRISQLTVQDEALAPNNERIKDEIREGRSFRSAVPRGWARARKTILSGNGVSFLAAAVLYFLAIGQVKGFAFTLGLTTILDTVVVFLVTWPLIYLASKSTKLARPALNGLGAVQQIARERRAATYSDATNKFVPAVIRYI